jgi:hypothetical protein
MPKDLEPGTFATAAIDVQAREELDALKTLVGDLAHSYWGDSIKRDNGVRSHVAKHHRYIGHLVRRADESDKAHQHYLDKKRIDTCHGIAELTKHLREHKSMSAHDLAIELAKMQGKDKTWDRVALIAIGVLSLVATIVTVLK